MTAALLWCLFACCGVALGQVQVPVDPYTRGEASRLDKAGYESLGPFEFGTDQTTGGIEALLGTEPLLWIETKHFRLGCSLSAVSCGGREPWRKEWRALLHRELLELRTKIPSVPKKPSTLDPWLRAHLFAHRLEKLYVEALAVVGVDDDWFPKHRGDAWAPRKYRGEGQYFGMPQKFTVLLLKKGASHARYMRAYHGIDMPEGMRSYDCEFGCAYWGVSEESANGLFRNDLALHSNLIFNVAHNLYSCFRGVGHQLPAWLVTGLGHWHARKISGRYPAYDRETDKDRGIRSSFHEWETQAHGLTKSGAFEDLDKFVDRLEAGRFRVEEHMQSWALVDYLLACRRPQMREFLHRIKDPLHNRQRMPSTDELLAHQRRSLIDAFDCDIEELDKAWREHSRTIKPRYRRR